MFIFQQTNNLAGLKCASKQFLASAYLHVERFKSTAKNHHHLYDTKLFVHAKPSRGTSFIFQSTAKLLQFINIALEASLWCGVVCCMYLYLLKHFAPHLNIRTKRTRYNPLCVV